MDFLKRLSTFDTFGKGWTDRVGRVKAKAISMANEA
jgi:lysozyme family protein